VILLDTHVIIWDALAPDRLSERAKQAISTANQEDGILICDISLWEIAMLIENGRVQVSTSCQSFLILVLQANKTIVQPITPAIATLSVQFTSDVTKDPADRLIAASALANNVPLVTADQNLQAAAQIPTFW